MCILKDLSVKIKILLLAVIMLVITCIVAAVGIFSNHQSKQAADDMYNRNLMTTQYLNEATVQLRTMESDVDYLLLQDFTPENQKLLIDDLIAKAKTIQGDADKIKEMAKRAQELGANAIVGVDIDYETVGANSSMLMVATSGTAVVI